MNLDSIIQKMVEHAKTSENECCGYIYKLENGDLEIEKKDNIAKSSIEFSMFGPQNIPCAYYHSHENSSEFSTEDILVSESLGLCSILVNKSNEEVKIYYPNGQKIPYEGRPFLLGYADCLVLTRDYYKHQLNIILNDEFKFINQLNLTNVQKINLSKNRFEHNFAENFTLISKELGFENWILEFFKWNNFRIVKDLKRNDILIFSENNKVPHHCAVYLGENKILHHKINQNSCIEKYSEGLKKKTALILRHSNYD